MVCKLTFGGKGIRKLCLCSSLDVEEGAFGFWGRKGDHRQIVLLGPRK